jgi:aspartate aminotransferase-like enzyme
MECVMVNMLEAGTRILVANNGIWGIRSQDMARRSACVALLTNVMCIDSQMRQKS